jgi:two-component system response regulator AtoC
MIRSYVLIGNEQDLAADLSQAAPAEVAHEIDLANPIALKEITKAAARDLEREVILKVLQANDWNRRKTAKQIKISYRSLLYKLQESKISALSGRPLKAWPSDAVSNRS